MIGLIMGQVYALNMPVAYIMTASGVGYEVELPLSAFCQLELHNHITLYTHMVVREDAQLLFGFLTQSDKEVFKKLIKVNGVGAKMALAILSSMTLAELYQCVENESDNALVRVPGIGKKTAQRLIMELKGKFENLKGLSVNVENATDTGRLSTQSPMQAIAEVESALISLGYKEKEAHNAIKSVHTNDEEVDTQTLLKATLRYLASF